MTPETKENDAGIPASILVVDDTPANLQVLTGMLKNRGYRVRPVPGGKLALLAAQRDPPDLILLDINMPDMNGYEVCERLKADEKLRGIPVIFISALTEQLDKVRAFGVGGVDYLTKPFQMEELHARVETHLSLRALQIQLEETNARLQEQLRHIQKMEVVGQLTGGVAHDFNNLLTIINGYSEILLDRLPADDASRNLIAEVHKAGERSAGLTRQLLAFSRQQVLAPRVLDLNAVVADITGMLRRLIGEDVKLSTDPAPNLWPVKADPGQVEQVVMNLAVNARDAMPGGGRLTIETRNVELDAGYAATHPNIQAGAYVLLSVTDTGCGMTADVQAKIFEPFFTTKGPGKGTGLGLATVHGIVKQSDGHFEVCTEVGVGTTFKVYLPRVESVASESKTLRGSLLPPQGTETVLLVEDDDGVRAFTRWVLVGCGYKVLEARDAAAAARATVGHAGPIHLLVTDVVMPGRGGQAVAEALVEAHPGARVLFVSGYTDDAVIRSGVHAGMDNFLQKPFSPTALAFKVREVLDTPGKTVELSPER